MWLQREMTLNPKQRGFHLITDEVIARLPELRGINKNYIRISHQRKC